MEIEYTYTDIYDITEFNRVIYCIINHYKDGHEKIAKILWD